MRRFVLLFALFILLAACGIGLYQYYLQQAESRGIVLYGNVDVRQVDLGFRSHGKVREMLFEEGDFVAKGSLMGTLDEQPYLDQVKQARASLDSIKVNLENAERLLKRRRELITDGSVSQEDLDNAEASRDALAANLKQAKANLGITLTDLKDTKIFAPTDGIILTRIREPGTVVKEGDPIYTLSVTSPVWIRAYIAEPLLGSVVPGMEALVHTDTPNGKVYRGKVGFISPVAEFTPKTVETTHLRTDLVYRIRVYVDNPDSGLRQGMPVTLELLEELSEGS